MKIMSLTIGEERNDILVKHDYTREDAVMFDQEVRQRVLLNTSFIN